MISAVTIDLWQTLLHDPAHNLTDGRRSRLDGIRRVLKQSGYRVSSEAVERAYEESGRELTKIWAAHQDISAASQVQLFLDCLEKGLGSRLPKEWLSAVAEVYTAPALHFPPSLAPGAASAIEALREQGLTLGIISNTGRTPGAILRKVLATHGLLEKFAVLTFSDEALVRKPDARIFHRTLEALGSDPSRAVHVGDDAEADVRGAKSAGMRAIHLSKNGGSSCADATIRSLFELPSALGLL